jgi:hypothetical protein
MDVSHSQVVSALVSVQGADCALVFEAMLRLSGQSRHATFDLQLFGDGRAARHSALSQ